MSTSNDHTASAPDPASINDWISAAYSDHAAAIHAMALRSTRDPETAAEVTQEAFIRLLTEARAGRYPDNVRAWLYRASANLVISRARRASVARRFAPRLLRIDAPAQPDAIFIERERDLALNAALATLSVVERTALVMAAQGASGIEIAAYLGRSHAATRTLMSRARLRLRVAMTRNLEDTAFVPSLAALSEGAVA